MDESHKHYIEQKKPDTQDYILYDCILVISKTDKIYLWY